MKIPEKYLIITQKDYQYAFSFHPEGNAYLIQIKNKKSKKLKVSKGALYNEDNQLSIKEILTGYTKKHPDIIDLTLLRAIYSAFVANKKEIIASRKPIITIKLSEFLVFLGVKNSTSKASRELLISKIKKYDSFFGILNNRIYPILEYFRYNESSDELTITSYYISNLMAAIDAIKAPKCHSSIVSPTLYIERNKNAVEIVHTVATTIVQSGDHIPHLKASTIIKRNEYLSQYLSHSTTTIAQNTRLGRAFGRAWELLRTHTNIEQTHKDIVLPKPSDVPTSSKLDKVYTFKATVKFDDSG